MRTVGDQESLGKGRGTRTTGHDRKMSVLTISPDLDAMLEFDEKAHQTRPKTPAHEKQNSAPVASTVLVGLPPPPRRRHTRSPTSPKVGSPLLQEAELEPESQLPNPYINPPPSLEVVLGVQRAGEGPHDGPCPKRAEGGDQLVDQQQLPSGSFATTRNRVDKLLSIGRIPFGRFSDVPSNVPAEPQPLLPVLNLNLRERISSKLCRVGGTVNDQLVDMSDNDRRRRDSLSHAWRSSGSSDVSSSESFTTDLATTDEAPSMSDPHISISSTIYPDSSVLSVHYPPVPPRPRITDRESFMDMFSPAAAQFDLPPSPPFSPKPPLPNAPKPIFNRLSPKTSPAQRYDEPKNMFDQLPQTMNFLDLDGRSDLIRKNKKLMRLFGQSPGPDALLHQEGGHSSKSVHPIVSDRGDQHTLSSSRLDITGVQRATTYPYVRDRRHSTPLGSDDFSLPSPQAKRRSSDYGHAGSSASSFIDLSDDLSSASPKAVADGPARPHSPSQQSIFENMSLDEQAEELRRRKREKLAKLHRFLGSQVPVNLVLGLADPETSLPPLQTDIIPGSHEGRSVIPRRRRCSSVEAYPSGWSDKRDRIRQDLNVKEKAINVRRAQKMEKVFGVAPPQTLYHTRSSPSPSIAHTVTVAGSKFVSGWISSGDNHPQTTGQRNLNQSSYIKAKKKKDQRPSTSDSNKHLLPKHQSEWSDVPPAKRRPSIVYSHYQESLNSLNDIMDRDDKESLAELREYLYSGDMTVPPPLQSFIRTTSGDRRASNASSIRSERRLSLPTSVMSSSSDYSISAHRPEVSDFQARRRRAAKLTQFFGVNYRELVTEVLESIEHGLEHERNRGTLNQDEVQDLLARLRKLRTKREAVF